MALTNEQLTYSITVKNNEINAKLSDSIEKAENLDEAMESLQNTVDKSSKIEQEYQKALEKSAETMAQNNEHIGRISQSTENLNRSFEQTTSIMDDLSQAISTVSMTVAALKKAYDIISDPRVIEAARDLLTIFEAMAVVKGFERLASAIEQARKKLEMLAESLDKVRSILSGNIFATIDASADKAGILLTSINLVTAAAKALAAALVGLAGFSIFATISRDGLSFGKIVTDLGATFSSVFRNITQGFSQLVTNLKNTTFASLQETILSIATAGTLTETIRVVSEALDTGITGAALRASAAYLALSIAIKAVVSMFGEFIQQIGINLSNAMDVAQTKFAKTQQIVTQFGFVVRNFGAAYGEQFIGSLAEWEGQIERLANTTSFSSNELRKSAKLVIAENKALGLSYEENVKFLDRAVEIAASSGLELFEVVQRLQSALVGNATAVAALGINLGSHALEHSELNKTIQKTVGTMTEQEKKQIALYEIYKQTEPLVGASIKQGQTIIGINQQLANSYEQIQSKLGSVNAFSMALSSTYADLVRNVSNLPDIFFDIAGTLGDLGGVLLQIIGFTIKWIFVIGTLTTIYKIFNAILVTNIALQTKLTTVAQFLGIAFNFQAASVTTASAAVAVLGKALKGGILFILGNVTTAIMGATKAIGAMTLALLANPLFLKAVAIVAAVSLFIKALDELNKELNYVEDTLAEFEDTFLSIKDTLLTVGKFLVTSFSAIVQIIKILILSIAELYQVAKIAYNSLRKLWNPEYAQEYQSEIDASLNSLDTLAMSHTKALDQITALWDKASGGGTAYAQTVDETSKKLDELAFRQLQMSKAAAEIDVATIRIEVLGTEVEKLTNRYSLAAKQVEKLSNEILTSSEINTEALKDYQTALEEQTQAAAQLDKLRIDSLKGIAEITKDVQKQTLKLTAEETTQINQEFDDRKLAVQEFEKQLARLGPVAGESAKQIIEAYKSIEQGRKEALKALQDKQDQEANENYLKFLKEQNDLLDDIAKRNRELQMEALGDSLTERQKINEMLRFDTEELEKQIEHYKTQWGAQSAVVQGLMQQKQLLKEAAAAQRDLADMQLPDWMEELGKSINKLFGKENIDAFFGYIREKVDELAATPIALQVQQTGTQVGAGPVGQGLNKVGEAIADGASALFNAGGAISNVLQTAGGWVGAIIDVFMNADKYLNILLEFPKSFLKVIQNLPALLQKFIDSFPGMIRAIAEDLPGIMLQLVDMIPDFINAMVQSMPLVIERLAEALPEILVKLIAMIPKLLVMIGRAMFLMIQSFVKGLIRGLGRLLSGIKIPRPQIDTKGLEEKFKKITGSSSRLFQVKDLVESAKDPMLQLSEGITKAFKKGSNWIKDAWMWVHDKILKPIFDALKAVWMWVYEKILLPIGKLITDAWTFVNEKIIKPIIDAFQAVFEFLNEKVFKPVINSLRVLFNFINDKIFQPFTKALDTVFSWVFEMFGKIWDGLTNAVTGAFSFLTGIGETIAEPIKNAFSGISDFFKGIGKAFESLFKFDFQGFAKSMGDALMAVLNPIFDILKVPVNAIIDFINNLKLPGFEVGFSVLGKKVSFGWGETDLVPGDIQRLASGGLVAGSTGLTGFGTDTVPIAATPGEFIVNRRGVETAGLDMLSMINRGISPQGQGATYNIEFEINIDAKTPMDEGFIRGKLVPAMRDELKRASLDGQFVISQRGIR